MKKIIQRTRRFEKSFLKLPKKIREKFIIRLKIFIEDEHAVVLRTHRLEGTMKTYYAFSVTGDVRAIYRKEVLENKTVFVFTFVDIGRHSEVY